MRAQPFPFRPWLELAALAALAGVMVLAASHLRFTVDDAYIAMRYSRNLAEGRGLVYNAGEYVEGYTSPAWVVLLAAAHRLGFGMVEAAHALGIALSALTLLLVHRMTVRALPEAPPAARLLPIAFLATSWIYAGWATGGLETALYAFAVVLGASHLQTRTLDSGAGRDWLPLTALLIALTRPEGMLVAGIFGLTVLWLDLRAGRAIGPLVRRWALGFGLPMAAFVAWRLAYYGEWLPNTFYVKVNKVEYVERGLPFFLSFANDSLFYVWGAVALAAAALRHPVTLAVLAYSGVYVAYTIWVGGDWMGYRFYHHLMPLLAFPIAQVLAGAFAPGRLRLPGVAAFAAMLAVTAQSAHTTYSEGRATVLTMGELDNYEEMDTPESWAIETGWALDTILRPEEAASASFAGFTAVYTDRTVVDSLGLTDKYVARLPAVRGGPGHEKFAPDDYLAARNVLLVNPWPGKDVAGSNREFVVEHAPGYYLYFDALVAPFRVAELLLPRGLKVWADRQPLFNRWAFEHTGSVRFDFEQDGWEGWTLTGTAFGASPRQGAGWSNAERISGFEGASYVNTFFDNSDAATGTARSRSFVIDGDAIHFRMAGGAGPGTALELWVDGARVRTASGRNSEQLVPLGWEVGDLRGRSGYLLIRDEEPGRWGHVVLDDIQLARRAGAADAS